MKKSNAGRKPISDKKFQVNLYIRESVINRMGGLELMKEKIYKFVHGKR